jgi:uncharacterized protein (UPF0332 family)
MNEQERKELVGYRLTKAKDTLQEIDILIENKLWNTAINRLYYACYFAVSGLLLKHKINAQTHAGVRQMLGLHFIKTGIIPNELGKLYSNLFSMRQSSDYDDFITFEKDDVLINLSPTKELIQKIEELTSE